MPHFNIWLVLSLVGNLYAEKTRTCWDGNKCIDVYSTKYVNNDDQVQLTYSDGVPAINYVSESLPKIQLIGDYSGVGDSELKVVLAWEQEKFNFTELENVDILGMDFNHGVKISKGYNFDKNTGIFDLAEPDHALSLESTGTKEFRQIGLCLTESKVTTCKFVSKDAKIQIYKSGLTITQQYMILAFLLCLSGLFSGLNLGLMALDPRQLESLKEVPDKAKDASVVYPVRKTGNFLLCVLLLGNTLVNTTLSVLTGDLFTGIVAVIGSTFGIVIFGEIIPQSLCSRHGLKIGAKTIWLTKVFMVITAPIAWPISKLLDCVLGEEMGAQLVREELVALINVGGGEGLEDDEKKAVKGALELSQKKVGESFTKLRNVFMISEDAVLDYKTVAQIMSTGYTRIPIYKDQRTNIVGLLLIRDLAFVDPDDATTLKMLMQENHREIFWVTKSLRLDMAMEQFLEHKSHIAAVFDDSVSINDLTKETMYQNNHEAVGIITLEDVMEQLIQTQIFDETDREPLHNRPKKDSLVDNPEPGLVRVQTGVDLTGTKHLLAAARYLVNNVSAFSNFDSQCDTLLKYIRMNNVYNVISVEDLKTNPKLSILMSPDEVSNYFILILEGFCTIQDKSDEVSQQKGPFDYIGHKALSMVQKLINPSLGVELKKDEKHDYIANYEVSIKETEKFKEGKEKFVYIKITQDVYMQALREELKRQSRKGKVVREFLDKPSVTELPRKRNLSEGVRNIIEHKNSVSFGDV